MRAEWPLLRLNPSGWLPSERGQSWQSCDVLQPLGSQVRKLVWWQPGGLICIPEDTLEKSWWRNSPGQMLHLQNKIKGKIWKSYLSNIILTERREQLDSLYSQWMENYEYWNKIWIPIPVQNLQRIKHPEGDQRSLLCPIIFLLQDTSHSYSLFSSDQFQHPLRPFGIAEIPFEEGSDCDLIAVNIPR